MVDWSFDDKSRSISLEAGGVTGAVLLRFCFAIIRVSGEDRTMGH